MPKRLKSVCDSKALIINILEKDVHYDICNAGIYTAIHQVVSYRALVFNCTHVFRLHLPVQMASETCVINASPSKHDSI